MVSDSDERDLIERLADSFVARIRAGERPSATEYVANYPQFANELPELFSALWELEQDNLQEVRSGRGRQARFDPPPETLGEFRLVREIGRGGMGVVYEAVQESLGRLVALKVLSHDDLQAAQLQRFRREARAAARLHHNNIVPVFGVGEQHGIHYYAMQYIDGQSLDIVIDDLRLHADAAGVHAAGMPTDVAPKLCATSDAEFAVGALLRNDSKSEFYRRVARIGVQAADALSYAHAQGVLHRDIKPSNLLLDVSGDIWIADFGLAKTEECDELSRAGDLLGTLRYMAPERFDGWADRRSDVYSLGATLYELLTLKPLFAATSRPTLIRSILQDSPGALGKCDRRIPRDLRTIVEKAIAKNPQDRYANAQELASEFRLFLADRPIRARRDNQLAKFSRWCQRNPMPAFLAGALLFVTMAGMAGVSWKWREAEHAWRQEAAARQEAIQRAQEIQQRREQLVRANALVDFGSGVRTPWDEELDAYTQAIEICPELVSAREKRGDLLFQLGLYELAAVDLLAAQHGHIPHSSDKGLRLTLLQLSGGDVDRYLQLREEMWAQWRNTRDPGVLSDLLVALLVACPPVSDLPMLLELAQRADACLPDARLRCTLALAHLRAKDFERCIQACLQVAQIGDSRDQTAMAQVILAIACHENGDPARAEAALRTASDARESWIEEAFSNPDGNWIVTYGATEKWPIDRVNWLLFEVLYGEACKKLSNTFPVDDPRLHVLRGRAFMALRRYNEVAEREYDAALRVRLDAQIRLEALRSRGLRLFKSGDYGRANQTFLEALDLAPGDIRLWRRLTVAQLASGQVEESRETCRLMFERFSRSPAKCEPYFMIWACTLHPDFAKSADGFMPVATSASQWWLDSQQIMVAAHYRNGEYAEALRSLTTAPRVTELHTTTRYFAAMALYRLGRHDEARRKLSEAIRAPQAGDLEGAIAASILRKEAKSLILARAPQSLP